MYSAKYRKACSREDTMGPKSRCLPCCSADHWWPTNFSLLRLPFGCQPQRRSTTRGVAPCHRLSHGTQHAPERPSATTIRSALRATTSKRITSHGEQEIGPSALIVTVSTWQDVNLLLQRSGPNTGPWARNLGPARRAATQELSGYSLRLQTALCSLLLFRPRI